MSKTLARRLERLEQRWMPEVRHVIHVYYANSDRTRDYGYTIDPGSNRDT